MAVMVIPFSMPEPMEIPEHIIASLRAMAPDEAVHKSMELLAQIDAAELLVYDKVVDDRLELGSVYAKSTNGAELEQKLKSETCYGQPLDAGSLTGSAFAQGSALLVMGQVEGDGEQAGPFPRVLREAVLGGASNGDVGFNYVLTFQAHDGRALGALTLMRPHGSGPLNHEQPNVTEGLRRLLGDILQGGT